MYFRTITGFVYFCTYNVKDEKDKGGGSTGGLSEKRS